MWTILCYKVPNSVQAMERALSHFTPLSQKLGLVINENNTKFMCRSKKRQIVHINGKEIEGVESCKYLGVYVGYTAESKDAELNDLTMQFGASKSLSLAR